MSRQRPRHGTHKALASRVGAALAIPALIAAAIYAVASDKPDVTQAHDYDTITFAPDEPTVDPIPTPTSTGTPTSSPTGPTSSADPTETTTPAPSATPEPDPSPSRPEPDRDDDRTPAPSPNPTYTYSPPPDDDPPEDDPPEDDPPDDDPPDEDAPASIDDLLAELQAERASAGCAPLTVDGSLMRAAQQLSEDENDASAWELSREAGYDGDVDSFTRMSFLDDTPRLREPDRREVTECDNEHVGIGRSGFLIYQWAVILGEPDRHRR